MTTESDNEVPGRRRRPAHGSTTTAIAHELLRYLRSGHVSPGQRLPPEHKVASDLGVSRSAVREALAALEMLGIIVTRQGSGSYFSSSNSDILPQAIEWSMLLGARQLSDLLEARAKVECALAELAATKRTDEDLVRLKSIVDEMESSELDLTSPSERDLRFHDELATIARNPVLAGTLNSIQALMRAQVWKRLNRTPEQATLAVSEHRALYDAISASDAPRAAQAMARHMESVTARIEGDIAEASPDPADAPR